MAALENARGAATQGGLGRGAAKARDGPPPDEPVGVDGPHRLRGAPPVPVFEDKSRRDGASVRVEAAGSVRAEAADPAETDTTALLKHMLQSQAQFQNDIDDRMPRLEMLRSRSSSPVRQATQPAEAGTRCVSEETGVGQQPSRDAETPHFHSLPANAAGTDFSRQSACASPSADWNQRLRHWGAPMFFAPRCAVRHTRAVYAATAAIIRTNWQLRTSA